MTDHFRRADAEIEHAVAALVDSIQRLMLKRPDVVAPSYIIERTMVELCKQLPPLIDGATDPSAAMLALSNAMADFCDSRWQDHGT